MDEIIYNDETQGGGSILYSRFERSVRVPAMVRWILATGIARDDRSARRVLLGVALAAIVAGSVIFVSSTGTPVPPTVPGGASAPLLSPSGA
ncbi:MAG: hypothetical protein Q7S95_03715 [bacterium]|nr:hypothetical protein [bacterium]